MDSIITAEDEESLKRIRWTTIDIVVPTTETTFNIGDNTVSINSDKMACHER